MIKVFCVDIGYSLKLEYERWKNNQRAYSGQALYGINHFEENEIEPVFECINHGYIYGKWYSFFDELFKLFCLIRYKKKYDIIYIPHAHYSRWIIVLKKMHIINKPIAICIHNKNNLGKLISTCDFVFSINPFLVEKMKKYNNISYIPLAPEKTIKVREKCEIKYDIVSIGNTYRDYKVLINAMWDLPYSCLIVTTMKIDIDIPNNVTVLNEKITYQKCMELYEKSYINIIPIKKKAGGGVFGLTSLVDALTLEKPIIISKTDGIGIEVEKMNLGIEVIVEDVISMKNAIYKLMKNDIKRKQIIANIKKYKINNNMESSTKKICDGLKQII